MPQTLEQKITAIFDIEKNAIPDVPLFLKNNLNKLPNRL